MAGMRSRHRMRCKAGRRGDAETPHDGFTVRGSPKHHTQPIKCPACGSEDVVSIEAKHRRQEAKQEKCYCHAVPHPHRKGSHRLCEHHPLALVDLTEDEERQAMDVANDMRRTTNR